MYDAVLLHTDAIQFIFGSLVLCVGGFFLATYPLLKFVGVFMAAESSLGATDIA